MKKRLVIFGAGDIAQLAHFYFSTDSDYEVVAFTVGPPAADGILREALAAGAARAIRIDLPFASPSRVVASNLAALLAEARFVWCGDYSADRGTGAIRASRTPNGDKPIGAHL